MACGKADALRLNFGYVRDKTHRTRSGSFGRCRFDPARIPAKISRFIVSDWDRVAPCDHNLASYWVNPGTPLVRRCTGFAVLGLTMARELPKQFQT